MFVHEKGAPHVIDPSKLINSANQLWGVEGVARLWGPVIPVPESNLTVLRGGERVTAASRTFDVQYTPGHASHHVSFFDDATGIAWVGDTGGIRFGPTLFTLPPTPPPDIDLEGWAGSLAKIRAWKPETLFITHFGPYHGASAHLDRFEASLSEVAEMARRALEADEPEAMQYAKFRSDDRGVHPALGAGDRSRAHGVRGTDGIQLARSRPLLAQTRGSCDPLLRLGLCSLNYSASPSPALSGSRNTHTRLMSAEIAM